MSAIVSQIISGTTGFLCNLRDARRHRRLRREALRHLDDRVLRDIGIVRSALY